MSLGSALRQEIADRAVTLFNGISGEATFKGFANFPDGRIPENSVYVIPSENEDFWFEREGANFAEVLMLVSVVVVLGLTDWAQAQTRMETLVYKLFTDLHLAPLSNGVPAVALSCGHVGAVGDDDRLAACAVTLKPHPI